MVHSENFEFILHDIREPIDLDVEEIYNLACPASPIHYQKDPIFTLETNVIGTLNLLKLAKKNKATFLQASTSEIYGDPEEHPQTESYRGHVNTIGPRSCYDEGKRVSESLMFAYHWQNKVDIKVARIFNTYGPKMSKFDGRVVSNFIIQALENKPITVNGDGSQTRSFCYISDMIDGLVKLMNSENFTGPVNLGNPVEWTILELAKKVIDLTKSKSQIIFTKMPQDDPERRKPDISLAKEKLNWEPKVDAVTGLKKTVEYFKNNGF